MNRLTAYEAATLILEAVEESEFDGLTMEEVMAQTGMTRSQFLNGRKHIYDQDASLLVPVDGRRYKVDTFVTPAEARAWEATRMQDMGRRATTEENRVAAAANKGVFGKEASWYQKSLNRLAEDARDLANMFGGP